MPHDLALADVDGGTIRQIAHAEYAPRHLDADRLGRAGRRASGSIFASATGAQNAALITGQYSGETGIFGAGAGGDATAVAIIGDLAAIARDRAAIVPAQVLTADFRPQIADCRFETSDFTANCSFSGGFVSALIGLQCHLCQDPVSGRSHSTSATAVSARSSRSTTTEPIR